MTRMYKLKCQSGGESRRSEASMEGAGFAESEGSDVSNSVDSIEILSCQLDSFAERCTSKF